MLLIHIRTDRNVVLKAKKEFSAEELRGLVGGYLEAVPIPTIKDTDMMLCNEDGRLLGLPLNEIATQVARQEILGNVFIVGRADPDFATVTTRAMDLVFRKAVEVHGG